MEALNPLAQANLTIQHQNGDKDGKLRAAAKQFEGVLMTQLLQVLWKTTPQMAKGQGGMYQSMFQGAFADHLVEGGGIGLSDMIAKALGAEPEQGSRGASTTRHPENLPAHIPTAATSGRSDVMADVARAASSMLRDASDHWAKNGSLDADDYGTVGASEVAGEHARRSVDNANGYRGYYKCNLFAFEVARRAGLAVPEDSRTGSLLLSSSNRLTQDASDGSLESGWAKVATGASPAVMQDALRAGEAAFLLVGSGRGEKHGHMAVIEKPRSVDYDESGQIKSISFQGWEAQPDGAKHLTQRTWNRFGEKGAPGDRNELERIEIIQLGRKPLETHAQPLADTDTRIAKP
jgi:Rod binding domain-containing protein